MHIHIPSAPYFTTPERQRLQLEIERTALKQEKDDASKVRLQEVQDAIQHVDENVCASFCPSKMLGEL